MPNLKIYDLKSFKIVGEFQQLLLKIETYNGENMNIVVPPVLANGERKLVLVTRDETMFDSNDRK